MTVATVNLSDTLQALIDARLDTIDRMLLGRVNRQDRLAIVREVETQIHDLLAGRDSGDLDRDDVLAVLARLDPPEAYLPDESTGEPAPMRRPTVVQGPGLGHSRPGRISRASGILGLSSLGLLVLAVILTVIAISMGSNSDFLVVSIFGLAGLAFVLGLLAVVLASFARLRGAMAIVGLVTGILSMLISLFGTIFLL